MIYAIRSAGSRAPTSGPGSLCFCSMINYSLLANIAETRYIILFVRLWTISQIADDTQIYRSIRFLYIYYIDFILFHIYYSSDSNIYIFSLNIFSYFLLEFSSIFPIFGHGKQASLYLDSSRERGAISLKQFILPVVGSSSHSCTQAEAEHKYSPRAHTHNVHVHTVGEAQYQDDPISLGETFGSLLEHKYCLGTCSRYTLPTNYRSCAKAETRLSII